MTTVALLLLFAVLLGFYLFLVVMLSWLSDRDPRPAEILRRVRAQRPRRIRLPRSSIWGELVLVMLAAVVLARGMLDLSPTQAPPGLAQAGVLTPVQFGLDRPGRVPTWNPYVLGGAPVLSAPDNYLYNLPASLPVLIFGTLQGTKLAVFLAVLVGGLGQWSLAWAVGVGPAARLTAALIFMGSGALGARFESGAFQLGWSLAWVPWAMAGLWLALATDKRWPRVVAALATACVFLSGSFFYVLPTLTMGTVVTLMHAVKPFAVFDREKIRRALLILMFAALLAAVQLLPVLAVWDYIAPPEGVAPAPGGYSLDLALASYFLNPADWDRLAHAHPALNPEADYAGVGWLPFGLIAAGLALTKRKRARAWLAGGASLALMMLWGVGLLAPFYERAPLLAGFRPGGGDALAAGAVWLALLAALALDELAQLWRLVTFRTKGRRRQALNVGAAAVLALVLVGGLLASSEHYRTRRRLTGIEEPMEAIRQQIIDEGRPRWTYLGEGIDPHVPYDMKLFAKSPKAGWHPLPRPGALPTHLNLVPAHAVVWEGNAAHIAQYGYRQEETYTVRGEQLVFAAQRRPPEYAFVVPQALLDHRYLFSSEYTPGALMENEMDRLRIWLQVPSEMQEPVLIVQETHFPGWQAIIDGAPAEVYTVGAYIGVRVAGGVHVVELVYTPPLLGVGLALSLLGLVGLAGYALWPALPHPRRLRAWVRLRRGRLFALELALIAALALSFALPVLDFSPDMRPPGREHERLSGLLIPAEMGLREYGRIPLWNPYLFTGEPLVTNPFSYLLNPFASLPVLALGALQGTKIVVALTVLIAGLNQWFFARVLGMGTVARVTTTVLYMCCGQIAGKFYGGHFQLGVSLAWPPLVLACVWLTLTTRRRWPKVLAAAAFAMLFFAGNIYYTLHTLIAAAVMAAFFAFRRARGVALAGLFALGLCAVQFLPVWAARDYIEHPGDPELVSQHPIDVTLAGYLTPHPKWSRLREVYEHDVYETVDYAYVGPLALVVLGLPVLAARRRDARFNWRAAWIGVGLFVLMFGWGTGLLPFINWLYAKVPLLAQFRFVGRVHAVATLWLAVVVGLVIDTLCHTVVQISLGADRRMGYVIGGAFGLPLALVLVYGLLDVHRVNSKLLEAVPAEPAAFREAYEMTAGRRQIEEYVYTGVLQDTYAYNAYYAKMRHLNLTEGWRPRGLPSEVGSQGAIMVWARYAVFWLEDLEAWREIGERQLRLLEQYGEKRKPVHVYELPESLPYAFLVSRAALSEANPLQLEQVKPITAMRHEIDRAAVQAVSTEPGELLVVLETNFPGWRAAVDGRPAELIHAGNYVGVEAAVGTHTYTFWFRPPALDVGLVVSGVTAALMGLYVFTSPAAESPARRQEQ